MSDFKGKSNQRRRCYLDRYLQGRLLVALTLLEGLLISAFLLFIHAELDQAMEQQIYRAHSVATESLPLLARVLLQTLPWFLLVNISMVGFIYALWTRAIRGILNPLVGLLGAVDRLDLRQRPDLEGSHELLEQSRIWLTHERQRYRGVVKAIESLDLREPPQALMAKLKKIRLCLGDSTQTPNVARRVRKTANDLS